MDILCFCTCGKERHWLYLLGMLIQRTALEDRDTVSFQSKEQKCLLSSIIKTISPSRQKSGRLTVHYKRFGLLTFDVPLLSCNLLYVLLLGSGNQQNADAQTIAIVVSNKLFFVTDPGVSCLLSASMRLWQINLLACMYSIVKSDRLQILTMSPR